MNRYRNKNYTNKGIWYAANFINHRCALVVIENSQNLRFPALVLLPLFLTARDGIRLLINFIGMTSIKQGHDEFAFTTVQLRSEGPEETVAPTM